MPISTKPGTVERLKAHVQDLIEGDRAFGSVIYVGCVGFTRANERYGHSFGDDLSLALFHRLRKSLRATDYTASEGVGSFIVLVKEIANHEALSRISQRLIRALSEPIAVGSVTEELGISIGFSEIKHSDSPDTVVSRARLAAEEANKSGPNRWAASGGAVGQVTSSFFEQVKKAVYRDEFELFYQPQVDPRTRKVVGAEALIRWRKPDGTYVPPKDFMPQIERSRLVALVGDWVIRTAVRQQARWHKKGIDLILSVNVSPRHLPRKDVVRVLQEAAHKYGVLPSTMEVEITEGQVLDDVPEVDDILARITGAGFRVALDDMGTAHAAMDVLYRYPFTAGKLDKSFLMNSLEDPRRAVMVRDFHNTVHTSGYETVAEGVETEEHEALVRSVGYDRVQGFFYAQPMPAARFEEWMQGWSAGPDSTSDKGDSPHNQGDASGDP